MTYGDLNKKKIAYILKACKNPKMVDSSSRLSFENRGRIRLAEKLNERLLLIGRTGNAN